MGIFSEADRHPFLELDAEGLEEARGGLGADGWLEEARLREFVRSGEANRGLYIRDESLT